MSFQHAVPAEPKGATIHGGGGARAHRMKKLSRMGGNRNLGRMLELARVEERFGDRRDEFADAFERLGRSPSPTDEVPLTREADVVTGSSFREATRRTAARHGRIARAIARLLDEYHELTPPTSHLIRVHQILDDLQELALMWIEDHATDTTTRGTERYPAVEQVLFDAAGQQRRLPPVPADDDDRMAAAFQRGTIALHDDDLSAKFAKNAKEIKHLKSRFQGRADVWFASILGRAIEAAVPTQGSTSTFDIDVEFPVDPSGSAFVGLHIKFSGRRDGNVTGRVDVGITAGGKLAGDAAKLKGELGGYMECSAGTGIDVAKLFSYIMYRRFVESQTLPHEISSFLWGGAASTVGRKRADKWSRAVESEIFAGSTTKTYAESGKFASLTAKVGIEDVGDLQGQLKGSYGHRIDIESLQGRKGGAGKKNRTSDHAFTKHVSKHFGRGADKRLGKSTTNVEVSGQLKAGPFTGKVLTKYNYMSDGNRRNVRAKKAEWRLEASAALPLNKQLADEVLNAQVINQIVRALTTLTRQAAEHDEGDGFSSKDAGALLGVGTDAAAAFGQLTSIPKKDFALKFAPSKGVKTPEFSGSVGVKISGALVAEDGKKLGGYFSVDQIASSGVKLPVGKIMLSTSTRLFKLVWKDGKWDGVS